MNSEPIMTTDEVSVYLNLHPLTVRRLARDGEIPATKIGRQWRFKRDLLDRWIEEQSIENTVVPPDTETEPE
jgi:excisionase family DNA binding protein